VLGKYVYKFLFANQRKKRCQKDEKDPKPTLTIQPTSLTIMRSIYVLKEAFGGENAPYPKNGKVSIK